MAHSSTNSTLAALRARNPLVHCLTNPVAAALTANALLSLGASPLMAEAEAEMEAVAGFANALLINLGMQSPARMASARAAIGFAAISGTPWVLDPVATGAIPARSELAEAMAANGPRLIKGNASEILALDGGHGGRGTDATNNPDEAIEAARRLARQTGAVVAITGAIDWVTDGARTQSVRHGHPMMAQVSGLGCVAGAMAAACLAVEPDALLATCHALTLFGIAGERAGRFATGPGTFMAGLLDALHLMTPGSLPDAATVEV